MKRSGLYSEVRTCTFLSGGSMGKRATRPRICQSLQCLDRRISNVVSLLQYRRRRFWAMEWFCVCVRVRVFVCLCVPSFVMPRWKCIVAPLCDARAKWVCNAVDSRECLNLVVICVQWARRNKSRTPVFRYTSNVHCSLDITLLPQPEFKTWSHIRFNKMGTTGKRNVAL